MKHLILFCLILASISCTTYKKCADKYGNVPALTEVKYDTVFTQIFVVAPDSSETILQYDTLQPGIVYNNNTDSLGIQIQYWIDKYTRLFNIKAKQPEKIVAAIVGIHDTVPCPPQVVFKQDIPRHRQYWNKYCTYAGLFLPVLILLIILFRRR